MYEVVVVLMPLFVFDVVGLFNFSHSFGSVVIALGGFCLHFLLISDVEKFIFAYWPIVYHPFDVLFTAHFKIGFYLFPIDL